MWSRFLAFFATRASSATARARSIWIKYPWIRRRWNSVTAIWLPVLLANWASTFLVKRVPMLSVAVSTTAFSAAVVIAVFSAFMCVPPFFYFLLAA